LGETLVALAYAPAVGDPATLLGSTTDVSHRHTFGVSERVGTSTEAARRTAWRRPTPGSKTVSGEAITGSLFGTDVALARKQLREMAGDKQRGPAKLNGNNTETLITTVALLNPRGMTTANLSAIGAALARGRERVRTAMRDPAARDALAADARMSSVRRQLLSWTADHLPDQVERLFSVSELFWLGIDTGAVAPDALDPS